MLSFSYYIHYILFILLWAFIFKYIYIFDHFCLQYSYNITGNVLDTYRYSANVSLWQHVLWLNIWEFIGVGGTEVQKGCEGSGVIGC